MDRLELRRVVVAIRDSRTQGTFVTHKTSLADENAPVSRVDIAEWHVLMYKYAFYGIACPHE